MFVATNFNKFILQTRILPFFESQKMEQKNSEARFFSATYSQKRCADKKKIIIFAELLRREVGSAEEQPTKRQNIAFIHKKKHLKKGVFFYYLVVK